MKFQSSVNEFQNLLEKIRMFFCQRVFFLQQTKMGPIELTHRSQKMSPSKWPAAGILGPDLVYRSKIAVIESFSPKRFHQNPRLLLKRFLLYICIILFESLENWLQFQNSMSHTSNFKAISLFAKINSSVFHLENIPFSCQ